MKEVLRTVGPSTSNGMPPIAMCTITRTSERINSNGDVIDPITKQIIKKNKDKDE